MRILFHKKFEKEYKKMPPQKKVQCEKRLILFIDEPFHPILSNHRLRGKLKDLYSINVAGDMRALYRIIDAETIEFVLLDTHSNLYE